LLVSTKVELRVFQVAEVMQLLDPGHLVAAGALGVWGLGVVPATALRTSRQSGRLGWHCVGEVVASAAHGIGGGCYWWTVVDEVAVAVAAAGGSVHGEGERGWRVDEVAAGGADGEGAAAAALCRRCVRVVEAGVAGGVLERQHGVARLVVDAPHGQTGLGVARRHAEVAGVGALEVVAVLRGIARLVLLASVGEVAVLWSALLYMSGAICRW